MTDNGIIVHPNCKICNSDVRAEIDEMLMLGVPYAQIITKLGARAGSINTKNISNHKRKHLNTNIPIDIVKKSVQTGIVAAHERAFNLQFENQRLRAEVMMAEQKTRMVQQAAVYLMIVDQLPDVLDQVRPADVISATKALGELMGDVVIREELQVDIAGELGLDGDTLKTLGKNIASEISKANGSK